MPDKNLKNQVMSGLIWKFGERIIAQGISFIISVVLARLLLPEQYGTVSLVLIFITLANVFVTDGLGASLIQKRDANELDFSTMFFCSLVFSVALYIILFLSAPIIAGFYDKPELIPVIRVMSLQVPLSAIKTIQHSYVSKHMLFRKFFFSTLGGTIVSGVIGIIMAYKGYGVWALVEQYLVNSVIDMTVLFFTVKWRPHFQFSWDSAKSLMSYSWKLLASSLINTIYTECRSLIIGKVYSESDLAYNSKGGQFPSLVITNINASISTVLFPAMSKVNGDMAELKALTRKSMKTTSYVIFPMMVGMMAVASPMIRVLLTDKWIACVPFLQIACVYWMCQPCQTANVQALKAAGRSDICLKLEIVKKIIGFTLVASTMFISVYALAVSNAAFAIISSIINIFPNRKVINYGFKEQIRDLLPSLLLSALMGILVWSESFLPINDIILLGVQVVTGAIIYIAGSKLLKLESYQFLLGILKSFLRRR